MGDNDGADNDDASSRKDGSTTYHSGPVTRNPFLNFLREYRLSNGNKKVVDIAIEGGKLWRKMDESEKSKYKIMASKVGRRHGRRRRRHGRSRSRRRRRRRSRR
ncbi:PREDICTED: protamine-like [Nicrophorus vespilloides]|uniref:Protamine-like n=1 Tax=Nicrophorus vespilloides TaxID=110193 RepID=A0ABM1N425_NICVS|nr:PREDICTED: protamine-like [Nicrophorus vespilloides]